tara:strand:+ start:374 stop:556 length:183 start_codon:yes stop_codon:yes gene_type:complete
MGFGKIYETTYWGQGAIDNTIGWGNVYEQFVDPTEFSEILAENGDFLLTEQNEYIILNTT